MILQYTSIGIAQEDEPLKLVTVCCLFAEFYIVMRLDENVVKQGWK